MKTLTARQIELLHQMEKQFRNAMSAWKYGRERGTADYSDDYCLEQEKLCLEQADALAAVLGDVAVVGVETKLPKENES